MDEIDFAFIRHWLRFREMKRMWIRNGVIVVSACVRCAGILLPPTSYKFFVNDIFRFDSTDLIVCVRHHCVRLVNCIPFMRTIRTLFANYQFLYYIILFCTCVRLSSSLAHTATFILLSFIVIWNIFPFMSKCYSIHSLLEHKLCQLSIVSAFVTTMVANGETKSGPCFQFRE